MSTSTDTTMVVHPEPPAQALPPSQLALDNLVETLSWLHEEARALLGGAANRSQGTIIVSGCPAEIWHALPGEMHTSIDFAWKTAARLGMARISVFCEHGQGCPAIPPAEVVVA